MIAAGKIARWILIAAAILIAAIALALFGLELLLHARYEGVLVSSDPACAGDRTDPYDPELRFSAGAFAGECDDASSVRALIFLGVNPDGSLEVANFFHLGHFNRARIPGHVRAVLYQIVPFESHAPGIVAAHTQLRFLFAPGDPIALSPQSTRKRASDADDPEQGEARDLIVSSTITAPAGEHYRALTGLRRAYGIASRALSSVTRAKEEILVDGSVVRQLQLKLGADERDRLLRVVLERASSLGETRDYRLLEESCATEVFDALDQVRPRPPGVPPMRGGVLHARDEFIGPSIAALRARDLIDDQSELAPMNAELRCDAPAGRCFTTGPEPAR